MKINPYGTLKLLYETQYDQYNKSMLLSLQIKGINTRHARNDIYMK